MTDSDTTPIDPTDDRTPSIDPDTGAVQNPNGLDPVSDDELADVMQNEADPTVGDTLTGNDDNVS